MLILLIRKYFILISMTSKVIEGHKSSSNFSVIPTLPPLDGPLMLPPPNCEEFSHSPSRSLFPSRSFFPSLFLFPPLSLFPSLSLTHSLYIPLLLYAKIILHTAKCIQIRSISICHLPFRKVILGIRLSCQAFWCRFLVRPLFMLYFAVREIYEEFKEKSFLSLSPSLSLFYSI